MEKVFETILLNGDKLSGITVLFAITVLFLVALQQEWLYLPGPVKEKDAIIAKQDKTLEAVNEELREQDKAMAKYDAEREYLRWHSGDGPRPETPSAPSKPKTPRQRGNH